MLSIECISLQLEIMHLKLNQVLNLQFSLTVFHPFVSFHGSLESRHAGLPWIAWNPSSQIQWTRKRPVWMENWHWESEIHYLVQLRMLLHLHLYLKIITIYIPLLLRGYKNMFFFNCLYCLQQLRNKYLMSFLA